MINCNSVNTFNHNLPKKSNFLGGIFMKKKYFNNGMILCELNIGAYVYMLLGNTEQEITMQAQDLLNRQLKGLI